MPPRSATTFDLSALSERLQGTERGLDEFKATTQAALSDIGRQIQHLATHMDNRLRPQWGVLLSAFGSVMYVLIYFVIQPMQADMARTNAALSALAQQTITGFHDTRAVTVPLYTFERHAADQARVTDRLEDRLHSLEMRLTK